MQRRFRRAGEEPLDVAEGGVLANDHYLHALGGRGGEGLKLRGFGETGWAPSCPECEEQGPRGWRAIHSRSYAFDPRVIRRRMGGTSAHEERAGVR
jgi:hypothetical protein